MNGKIPASCRTDGQRVAFLQLPKRDQLPDGGADLLFEGDGLWRSMTIMLT
jgi:hypothetical protein